MRFQVVNGLVSFIGKPSEAAKIEKALVKIAYEMEIDRPGYFGDIEDDYEIDYGFAYDMQDFTIEQVKEIWRAVK
jgi:hypothetical protein